MKRILLNLITKTLIISVIVINIITINNSAFAQALTGTKTVGGGGNYATIKAALDALNSNGVGTGGVVFSLIDNAYAYSNTGATQATCMWIGASASPGGVTGTSAANTVTIKPASGKTPVITVTASANSQAGFTLNGADYIIFDGSNTAGGTTRDMTIQMAGNFTTRGFDFKDPGVGGGCTNNVIKNCKIIGYSNAASNYGIYIRNSAGSGDDENNNNVFENNEIYQTYYGIWFSGLSGGVDCTGNIARNNKIGSGGASSTYVACKGIYAQYQTNLEVSGNEIYNLLSNITIIISGVEIERSSSVSISKNKIHDIGYTGTLGYGGKGININTIIANPGITITNNFISGIIGDGDAGVISSTPTAIYIGWTTTAPTGGISICFNSVYLTANTSYGLNFNANAKATGVCVLTGAAGITMCSNIFRTSLGEKTGATINSLGYAVFTNAAVSPFATIDYNIYYITGQDNNYVGYGNSATCTLAQWRTFTGQDANSLEQDPFFTSVTDLHINPVPPTNYVAGTTCASITTDIDNDPRTQYVRGADENSSSLPIQLLSFTADCIGNAININWSTVSEINNDYFTIERSNGNDTEGSEWEIAGMVKGAGSSNEILNYSFIDNKLPPAATTATLYYRLKQTDYDGKFEYFQPLATYCTNEKTFTLNSMYPNPATDIIYINYYSDEEQTVKATVYNSAGSEILFENFNCNKGSNLNQLNLSKLPKGLYLLVLKNNSGLIISEKINHVAY
ncbi:MAG: T9SS type A sorting domain-containing protein [Bacteroidota bacterium]